MTAPASSRRATTCSLRWTASNVGGVGQYVVYRVDGDELLPGQVWTPVTTIPTPGQHEVHDHRRQRARERRRLHLLHGRDLRRWHPERPVQPRHDRRGQRSAGGRERQLLDCRGHDLDQAAPGVLANDADPDTPSPLTRGARQQPVARHGGAERERARSRIRPRPASAARIRSPTGRADGVVSSNVATVTITVTSANDGADDQQHRRPRHRREHHAPARSPSPIGDNDSRASCSRRRPATRRSCRWRTSCSAAAARAGR